MDLGLAGKVTVVTGGASNIGRAISLTFAREGGTTIIADIDRTQGERVAKEASAAGGRARYLRLDVTDYGTVEALVRQVVAEEGRVDVWVNSVGWTVDRLFLEKPRAEWEKEVQLNLWSVINCVRAVLPSMVERRSGSIVSVASDAGRVGEYREAVYSACKAGIIALSKAVAKEMGRHNIRLNVVAPGLTVPQTEGEIGEASMWTEMSKIFTAEVLEQVKKRYVLRRLTTPQDVANAVAFLASDAASFVTGQTLSVSGGYSMV